MTIQAVVVTHNSAGTVGACLSSLASNSIPAIVVDNASTDDTVVQVNKHSYLYLKENKKNEGFALAANQGAELTTADIIFFLNPDAYLLPDSLNTIIKTFQNFPRAGVIGFLLCSKKGLAELNSFGSRITPMAMLKRKFAKNMVPKQATKVGWVSGGAMAVRAPVWQALGGFDKDFFMYWEDVDLCERARRAGFDVLLEPAVRITHERGASLKDQDQKTALYDASTDRYFKKHYSWIIWGIQHIVRRLYRRLGFLAT